MQTKNRTFEQVGGEHHVLELLQIHAADDAGLLTGSVAHEIGKTSGGIGSTAVARTAASLSRLMAQLMQRLELAELMAQATAAIVAQQLADLAAVLRHFVCIVFTKYI